MTEKQVELNEVLLRTAEQYRFLFFDMRDKWWAEEQKVAELRAAMARQRAVILALETRLGIDQEL